MTAAAGPEDDDAAAGAPPAIARAVFGARLPAARRYADHLATAGVLRGLLGPREVPRIWTRHLLNGVAVRDLVAVGAHVIDVGSGAGLPGIPLALSRPDLMVTLVEPMQRRTSFLQEVVDDLALSNVVVVRGRAPDVASEVGRADYVVARAVAPLDRLVKWCLPLMRPRGAVLAIKGVAAASEVRAQATELRDRGVGATVHELHPDDELHTYIVEIRRRVSRKEQ